MDTSNWRDQLHHHPEARRRIHIIILQILKSSYYYCLDEVDELLELQKIAQSVEHKCYAAAASQYDYAEKIAFKMILLEKERKTDWRNQLQLGSRQRLVNRIVVALRANFLVSGPEGSQAIWRLALMMEEKAFTLATDQSDYTHRIASKMLAVLELASETRHHGQQPSNQFVVGTDNEHTISVDMKKIALTMDRIETHASQIRHQEPTTNLVDMNLRLNKNSRSRKRPAKTRNDQMD